MTYLRDGLRVVESVHLVEKGQPRLEWVPAGRSGWQVRRVVVPLVPYPGALRLNATTVVMHPATLREWRRRGL